MEFLRAVLLFILFIATPFVARHFAKDTEQELERPFFKIYWLWFLFFILATVVFVLIYDPIGDNSVAGCMAGIYTIFAYLLILTPLYIRKYLTTPYHKGKDLLYFVTFLYFTASGLLGIIITLANMNILEAFLTSYLFLTFAFFMHFIPITICICLRDRR